MSTTEEEDRLMKRQRNSTWFHKWSRYWRMMARRYPEIRKNVIEKWGCVHGMCNLMGHDHHGWMRGMNRRYFL